MTTGQRLKMLREQRGQSQADIAKLLGIGRTTYLKYENGENKPTRKLKELSALFNVTSDYIMGLSDDPHGTMVPEGKGFYEHYIGDAVALTEEEQSFLTAFRNADEVHKNLAYAALQAGMQGNVVETPIIERQLTDDEMADGVNYVFDNYIKLHYEWYEWDGKGHEGRYIWVCPYSPVDEAEVALDLYNENPEYVKIWELKIIFNIIKPIIDAPKDKQKEIAIAFTDKFLQDWIEHYKRFKEPDNLIF